jgi:hypothetical protein
MAAAARDERGLRAERGGGYPAVLPRNPAGPSLSPPIHPMPTVRLPDGSTRDLPATARVADCIGDAATTGGKRGTHAPVAALLDGKVVGLDAALPAEAPWPSSRSWPATPGPCR